MSSDKTPKDVEISAVKPASAEDRLLDLACACGNLTNEVIHTLQTGKIHPCAALKPVESPILTMAKHGDPKKMKLAGITLPMDLIDALRLTALEVLKEKGVAVPDNPGEH